MDTALFVSGSKAGRKVGRGGSRGGSNKGKLDSRGRSESLSSQAKITCNNSQKPGHIPPYCPERQYFKCRRWSHEAFSCPFKGRNSKDNEEKEKKDESAVMAVDQEPDPKVTTKTKLDEIDGGRTTCFMTVEIENSVPPVGELPPETTVERWVADSGCSQPMTTSADYKINYREGRGVVISGGIQPRHEDKGKGNGCNTQRNKNTDGEKEATTKRNKRMRYTGTRSISMG